MNTARTAIALLLVLLAASAAAATTATLPAAPLGLVDVAALLDQADQIAARPPDAMTSASTAQVLFCLEESRRYCERLASSSIGQIRYRWSRIASKKADPAPGKRVVYSLTAPASAGAARLDSRGGDIFVKEMTVVKKDGTRQIQQMGRWVYSDLPKRHVIYFFEPADVSAVEVSMYRKWPETARLVVELGVPDPPDYAREIGGLCVRAQTALQRTDLPACRTDLSKARQRLEDFRKDQAK